MKNIIIIILLLSSKVILAQDTLSISRSLGKMGLYFKYINDDILIDIKNEFEKGKLCLYRDQYQKRKITNIYFKKGFQDQFISIDENKVVYVDTLTFFCSRIRLINDDILEFSSLIDRAPKINYYVRISDIKKLKNKFLDLFIVDFLYKFCYKNQKINFIDFDGIDLPQNDSAITIDKVLSIIAFKFQNYRLKNTIDTTITTEKTYGNQGVKLRFDVIIDNKTSTNPKCMGITTLGFEYMKFYQMSVFPEYLYLKTNQKELNNLFEGKIYEVFNVLFYYEILNDLANQRDY